MKILTTFLAIVAILILAINTLVWCVTAYGAWRKPQLIQHIKFDKWDLASMLSLAYVIAWGISA